MLTINTLAKEYLGNMDEHEARSIVRMVLEDAFDLSYTDVCCGALDRLSAYEQDSLFDMLRRISDGEPVQYVVGHTYFWGRCFHVESGVLIPRPETEELCQWIVDDRMEAEWDDGGHANGGLSILDIGTGSGIISITLSKELPGADVEAWDISNEALDIARDNAVSNCAQVKFRRQDALRPPKGGAAKWDVIVSNPPYICDKEAAAMEACVLDHEPHLALFVPDADPLLFYRKIAEYGRRALKPGGRLYFEINPLYAAPLEQMLVGLGYSGVSVRRDQFGKERMVRCNL